MVHRSTFPRTLKPKLIAGDIIPLCLQVTRVTGSKEQSCTSLHKFDAKTLEVSLHPEASMGKKDALTILHVSGSAGKEGIYLQVCLLDGAPCDDVCGVSSSKFGPVEILHSSRAGKCWGCTIQIQVWIRANARAQTRTL